MITNIVHCQYEFFGRFRWFLGLSMGPLMSWMHFSSIFWGASFHFILPFLYGKCSRSGYWGVDEIF